jgi:hypothetical protein
MFGLVASLFVFDLFMPDLIPFVDELLLGGGTILLGAWKKQRTDKRGHRNEDRCRPRELPTAEVDSNGEPPRSTR